jgi:hypothetical protein
VILTIILVRKMLFKLIMDIIGATISVFLIALIGVYISKRGFIT